MTIYSDLMSDKLLDNRLAVERLQKAEYIIGILGQMKPYLEDLGLNVRNGYGLVLNASGRDDLISKVNMKDVKILMDEYLFTNDRLEIDSTDSGEWILTEIIDKDTGGSFRFDIAMGNLICTKVEVSRESRFVEDITYRYDCE